MVQSSTDARVLRVGSIVVFLGVIAATGLTLSARQGADRLALIHQQSVFADMHAHPSRFHRDNVPRIQPEELARYQHGLIDLVVCNISTDAPLSGGYVTRDGTEIKRGELPRPKPGEVFAFTLDLWFAKTLADP
jgi:hypothetical protein